MCSWSAFTSHFGGDMSGVVGGEEAREKFPMRGGQGEVLVVLCDGGNGYRVRLRQFLKAVKNSIFSLNNVTSASSSCFPR